MLHWRRLDVFSMASSRRMFAGLSLCTKKKWFTLRSGNQPYHGDSLVSHAKEVKKNFKTSLSGSKITWVKTFHRLGKFAWSETTFNS